MKVKASHIFFVGTLAAGIAAFFSLQSKIGRLIPQENPETGKKSIPPEGGTVPSDDPDAPEKRGLPISFVSLSFILSCAYILLINRNLLLGDVCALVALGLACFVARGPRRRTVIPVFGLALIEIFLDFAIFIATTSSGVDTTDPLYILYIAGIGFIGLVVIISLSVTWLSKLTYVEPVALGVSGVMLILLCLPVLRTFLASPAYPSVSGIGYLFATGSPKSPLRLAVFTSVADPYINATSSPYGDRTEDFEISNLNGTTAIHWSLLLTGDARLVAGTIKPKYAHYEALTTSYQPDLALPAGSAQIISGSLGKGSIAYINGEAHGNFVNQTIDRTAVSLPLYGIEDTHNLSSTLKTAMIHSLDGNSAFRDNAIVDIFAGSLLPSQTLSVHSPYLVAKPSISGQLEWQSTDSLLTEFTTEDQSEVDLVNGALFSLAVLLGVAAAGLLASAQAFIHTLIEKSDPKTD